MRLRLWLGLACAVAAIAAPGAALAEEPKKPAATAPEPDVHVRYTLEGVDVRGNAKTATRVVLRYVRFKAGDVIDVNDAEIELTRYRLLGTGFFATVRLSLRKGSKRGAAVLVIDVEERNTLIVQNLWLGIAADEDTAGHSKPISAFLGVQGAETNLLGTGITLGAGFGVALDQIALRARFEDPNFIGTKWAATAGFIYANAQDFFGNRDVRFESPLLDQQTVTDYAVVAYKRLGATLGTGHDLSVSSSFGLEYRLEKIDAVVPTVASDRRGNTIEPIDFSILPGGSVLSTLRGSFVYDTRDAPFLTTRGTLASAGVTLGLPPLGSDYAYVRLELSAQRWWTLPWLKHVIRVNGFVGVIAGDPPFFEKFYVGDFTDLLPDRVLDLAPDRRQPPNLLGTDIVEVRYGEYAAQLTTEYRVPIYAGHKAIYAVDAFASGGFYGVASKASFSDPPSGYHGLARVPVDLTYNIGIRIDTKVGGATLAFSNLLGLLPDHTGARQ